MSGSADDSKKNKPEQDVDTIKMAHRLIERNASTYGAADTGHEDNHEQDVKTIDTTLRLVERATGLRGLSVCSVRDSKSTCRKRTERDLKSPEAEIPYIKTEHAIRDLVCSLMER